jgi:Ca2+-binding RTX toxin-like protein
MRKGKKHRSRRETLPSSAACCLAEPLEQRVLLAGVTFITHGYEPTDFSNALPGWVASMGTAIAEAAGPDSAIYNLTIGLNSQDVAQVTSFTQVSGPTFSESSDGQAVIELNWAAASGLVLSYTSPATIAQLVEPYLVDTIPSLGITSPLADLPIHLIGHSRGGSVVSALAEDLGESGVWVDQLTTLDPHPVDDPLYGDDPAVNVYSNVTFADNYYELNSVTDGEPIQNAYNVDLTNIFPPGSVDLDQHEDVHAYYYGTIDTNAQTDGAADSPITIDPTWYEYQGTGPRGATGFYYSLIVGGTRPVSGIGQAFGGSASRVALPAPSGPQSPDIGNIQLVNGTSHTIQIGAALDVDFEIETPDANASITWYLDTDRNPFDDSEQTQLPINSPVGSTQGSIEPILGTLSVPTANAPQGNRYVYAEIDDGGLIRYSYLPGIFTFEAPVPSIASINPTSAIAGAPSFSLTVNGVGFLSSSVVEFDGTALQTSTNSGTILTATVPASNINSNGTATITVFTPDPGGGTSTPVNFAIDAPVPTISSLNPNSVTAGQTSVSLTVDGSGFLNSSVIDFNGSPLATTTILSGNEITGLSASIPDNDITSSGTAQITVVTPGTNGETSAPATFTIAPPIVPTLNPAPVITSISPNNVTAGGSAFSVTVGGSTFIDSSVVDFDGSALVTTPMASGGQVTELIATVPASDIANSGTGQITVVTPGPGGGNSAAATLAIVAANTQTFAVLNDGVLSVAGTAGADVIILSGDGTNVTASLNGDSSQGFPLAQITAIDVAGLAGADSINIGANVPSVSVLGGQGADTIIAQNSNGDTLLGGKGADSIKGGSGNDSIAGGKGLNTLAGGQGNDTITTGPGDNLVHGGAGDDELFAGSGIDTLFGGAGNDSIFGVTAQDSVDGGAGNNETVPAN